MSEDRIIIYSGYLILERSGYNSNTARELSGRLMKGKPSLRANEISIAINVGVPLSLFQRPQIKAEITIPKESATPVEINAEVLDNLKAIVEKQIGVDVSFALVEPHGSEPVQKGEKI